LLQQERGDNRSAGSGALQAEAARIAIARDFLDRNSSGCLYGLTPPSPNEKLRKLLPPAHGS
jgi:hypothetical protein